MGFYGNWVFPRLMNKLMSSKETGVRREKLLAGLSGEVLEIGFGTGLNLPHYPKEVKQVHSIDPNPGMKKLAAKQIEASEIIVEMQTLSGENLPYEDGKFTQVVCTWTLCSIPDVALALREIYRVMKPGGEFRFVEHGLSDNPKVQKWQNRLNPIQRVVGDGCNLNRDFKGLVKEAGFSVQFLKNYYVPKSPKPFSFFYEGVVTKPPA